MKTFSKTDIGRKREVNQDYVFVSDEPVGNIPNLLIVADGMGGHHAGDYASRFTVEVLAEEVPKCRETGPETILGNSIHRQISGCSKSPKRTTDWRAWERHWLLPR